MSKPVDEEYSKTEEGQKEFMASCLYHGHMKMEPKVPNAFSELQPYDEDETTDIIKCYDFPLGCIEDCSQFQYNSVWSAQLLDQVKMSTHRFLQYLENPNAFRNEDISKYKKEWMQAAIELIPNHLLSKF